jgi:hypothetical protein
MKKLYLMLILLLIFVIDIKAQGVIIYGVSNKSLDTAINLRYRKFFMNTTDSGLIVHVQNSSGSASNVNISNDSVKVYFIDKSLRIINDSIKVWFEKALHVLIDSNNLRVMQNMVVNAKQSGTWSITTVQDSTYGLNVKQRPTDSMRVNGKVSISGSIPITGTFTIDSNTQRKSFNIQSINQQDTTKSIIGVRVLNQSTSATNVSITNDSVKTSIYGIVYVKPSNGFSVTADSITFKTNSTRKIGIVSNDTTGTSTFTMRKDTTNISTFSIRNFPTIQTTTNNSNDTITNRNSRIEINTDVLRNGTIKTSNTSNDTLTNRISRIETNTDKLRSQGDSAQVNSNKYLREYLGFAGDNIDSIFEKEVLSTIEMDSLITDMDKEKIWTPSTSDSTKSIIISFISISTGDSTMGYEILSLLNTGTTFKTLFKVTRLTGNAQVVMNFVGAPLVFPAHTNLYIRKIVPNGALYYKYIDGVSGSGLHVTIKYKYR